MYMFNIISSIWSWFRKKRNYQANPTCITCRSSPACLTASLAMTGHVTTHADTVGAAQFWTVDAVFSNKTTSIYKYM